MKLQKSRLNRRTPLITLAHQKLDRVRTLSITKQDNASESKIELKCCFTRSGERCRTSAPGGRWPRSSSGPSRRQQSSECSCPPGQVLVGNAILPTYVSFLNFKP